MWNLNKRNNIRNKQKKELPEPGGGGECGQTYSIGWVDSKDLKYSLVTTGHDRHYPAYLKVAKTVDHKSFQHTEDGQLYEAVQVLSNLTVAIIMQYIRIANIMFYTLNVHNGVCQFYLNKAGKTQIIMLY